MITTDENFLFSCARATTCDEVREIQANLCQEVASWPDLLAEAERHGIGPLLHLHLQHLGDSCPREVQRSSRLLYLRHKQRNAILLAELARIVSLFAAEAIDVLVLKGAALAQTVYADPGLRAMRDIDLLVPPEDGQRAQELLVHAGYHPSTAPRPDDHFHLPALHKQVDNTQVCVELHTALFPNCPPYYRSVSFTELFARRAVFAHGELHYYCFGLEDMLWHVFEHGLRMPLTYEPYKLVAVADLVTIIETSLYDIDLERLGKICPQLVAALPLIHQLTPWHKDVTQHLRLRECSSTRDIGIPFSGWPHLRLSEQRNASFSTILTRTFLPPRWWAQLYYGSTVSPRSFLSIVLLHARHIFWWARLYLHLGKKIQFLHSNFPIAKPCNAFLQRALNFFFNN